MATASGRCWEGGEPEAADVLGLEHQAPGQWGAPGATSAGRDSLSCASEATLTLAAVELETGHHGPGQGTI